MRCSNASDLIMLYHCQIRNAQIEMRIMVWHFRLSPFLLLFASFFYLHVTSSIQYTKALGVLVE